jgi:hypothetical protein
MGKYAANNPSYVYIPTDKLVEIIEHCCPPCVTVDHCSRLAYEDCDGRSCLECWKSWLTDGE